MYYWSSVVTNYASLANSAWALTRICADNVMMAHLTCQVLGLLAMSLVQQEAPIALYFHCAAHRLNLAVVSACSIQAFKIA